jgi:AAA domain
LPHWRPESFLSLNRLLQRGSLYGDRRRASGPGLDAIDSVFVDSITAASRLAYRWAEQQCGRDIRAAYGLLARELVCALQHLQHVRTKNVVLVAILERALDDFNRPFLHIQIEGQKCGRELPGIVDEIVTLDFIDFGDGKPVRAFANSWNYPAKDRSGRLSAIEKPNLGDLIAKITGPQTLNESEH